MNDEQIIRDPSDLRKYRIELPNLYDDADLDVYEFRVLAHYKRVGRCTEGTSTTAKKCKMSVGMVSKVRQSLADKKFIKMLRVQIPEGYSYVIEVADKWLENFKKYAKATPSPHERQASPHEATPSPHETKKEPIKNLRDIKFGEIVRKISELTGGGLNSSTADLINTWQAKHDDEWIFRAIETAREKGARSANYVDAVLINWEANGYPKSREDKVQGAKHATNNKGVTASPKTRINFETDTAKLAEINRRRKARQAASV